MLDWLARHGVYTGPHLEMDSLRLVRESMERLQSRGHGPDPLAEAFPAGRDAVEAVEWRGRTTAPGLVGDLRAQLLAEARKRREERQL